MSSTPVPRSQAGTSGVAFLLQLERRLRLLHDTGEILSVSAQLLGQRLDAQQVACFDIDQTLQCPTLQHAWSDGLATQHSTHSQLSIKEVYPSCCIAF